MPPRDRCLPAGPPGRGRLFAAGPLPALLLAAVLLLSACGTAPKGPGGPVASRLGPEAARDVAMHALGLVGTPYRYGGNTPEGGFDCSGLIGYVYRHGSTPVLAPRTVAMLGDWGQQVSGEALRTGDLVIFGARAAAPTHAGIYVGEGRFVHAPSTGGVVRMDRLDGPYWSRQQVSFRRP
ncbi:C40 family peptidase [Aquincola sp. MAHUQ-54]|uniref:C40 family peptidase n=1 Tax=Aquincola agrisoli TaxID=3119538 RepID=A0AAW9QC94_9BURK